MKQSSLKKLKLEISKILRKQGYKLRSNGFILKDNSRDAKRNVHTLAKIERIMAHKDFIIRKSSLVKQFLVDGKNLEINKIRPKLIEVKPGTKWEDLFKWWNLVWWSLPYEHAYGRQMRFIVWDQYHNAPIGLIGLQSPILSWSVRDDYLGISPKKRDYWVNQSLSAQRLGALPPYNYILGGKLVAYLMATDNIRRRFQLKYSNKKTIMKKRKLPARLLFITTTGAYGKSSVYTRLKFKDEYIARFIGYTQGAGSFHIPNSLFEKLVLYLKARKYNVKREFGNGPSRKLRLIDQSLQLLGFENGANHGVQRAVYLFPFAKNIKDVIQKDSRPKWAYRNVDDITSFWKERWSLPRAKTHKEYLDFLAERFVQDSIQEIERAQKVV